MADTTSVTDAVKFRHQGEDVSVLPPAASDSFLWGILHTVPVRPKEGPTRYDYVWDEPGESLRVFIDFREVITFVSVQKENILGRPGRMDAFLAKIGPGELISGIIAILLTLTIVYMVTYRSVTDVPGVLANALTMILGFYFGKATTLSVNR